MIRPLVILALCGLLTVTVTACGGATDDVGDSVAADGATSLTIELWPAGEGQGDVVEATLTCDPVGGDLPDPAAACAALAGAGRAALAPVDPGSPCTMIFGGPEQARITGTLDGAPVDARLERANGCEIDRWDRLVAVLPAYEPESF